MAISDSASLLFKIRGDSTDAVKAIRDVDRTENDLDGTNKKLGVSFDDLAGAASVFGAGLLAVGAAAVTVAVAIVDLTKKAAEFGTEIFDASQKTGLTTRSLSAMKFAADQSGTSLDKIVDASAEFAKTIADAANGSKEAEAKLRALGVTSTDLDTALAQALSTIMRVKPGTDQMAAAMDAFGESGVELLPFIKSFDGDLVKLTQKAKELGLTLEGETARQANQFSDTLKTLTAQLESVGKTIGFAFMPMLQRMADGFSAFLTKNKGEVKLWADTVVNQIDGVIAVMRKLDSTSVSATGSSLASWAQWALKMRITLIPIEALIFRLGGELARLGKAQPQGARVSAGADLEGYSDYLGTGAVEKNPKKAKEDNSAERAAQRERAANIQIELNNLKTQREAFVEEAKKLRETFSDTEDLEAYNEGLREIGERFAQNFAATLGYIERLEREQLDKDASEAERQALRQKQEERIQDIKKMGLDEEKKAQGEIDDVNEREFKRAMDNAEKRLDAIRKEIEMRKDLADPGPMAAPPTIPAPTLEEQGLGSIFDQWTASWIEFFDRVNTDVPDLTSLLGDFANMAQNAFGMMAEAIGSLVEQWVLYGDVGPNALRKILAATLAALAQEAAVKALFQLAEGFANLWLNPPKAATHFKAAAIYGAVAVVAGVSGRAVAGSAFSNQSSGGGARATGADEENRDVNARSQFDGFGQSRSRNPFQRVEDRIGQMMAEVRDSVSYVGEGVNALTGKIDGMPADAVVTRAAQRNPAVFREAVEKDLQVNPRGSEGFFRAGGVYD